MSSKKKVIDTYYMVRDAAVRRYVSESEIGQNYRISFAPSRLRGTRYVSAGSAKDAVARFTKQLWDSMEITDYPVRLKVVKVTVRQ